MGLRRSGARSELYRRRYFRFAADDDEDVSATRKPRRKLLGDVGSSNGDNDDDDTKKEQQRHPFLVHCPLTFMRLCARTRYTAAAGASTRMHSGDFPGQVPRRYSRGCTCRRSWCFQHPHLYKRALHTDTDTRVRTVPRKRTELFSDHCLSFSSHSTPTVYSIAC